MKSKRLMFACSQAIEGAPEIIPLMPLGQVHSQKGDFVVDEESFSEMCRWFALRGLDIVIDYEHQTLMDVQAPAAGWIKELILTDNAISGRVEWTAKAAEYLKNREYRYLSPVVLARKIDHKAIQLLNAALTNSPAIDGMFPIVNSEEFEFEEGEDTMDFLKTLAAMLGLPEGATEQEITDAVKAIIDAGGKNQEGELVANKTILSQLSLKDGATTADVTAKIATLQNQCSEISCKLAETESSALVELALKDGKITSPQKEWATQYALADKDGFKEFLSKALPVVPMQQLALSFKPGAPETSETDRQIARQLGVSDDDTKKYGGDR